MTKHIILAHGRHFKPEEKLLKKDWVDALSYDVLRDHDKATLDKFKKVKKTMVYYGDLSNVFPGKKPADRWTKKCDAEDVADRKLTLAKLKQYDSREFNKTQYKKICEPIDALKNVAANMLSGPLSLN